ncbi:MAG TPA: DinB family protein [Bacilli bacterium]
MSNAFAIRELLFEELYLAVRTTIKLITKVKAEHWEYRPGENMRSLKELANHLVQIPYVDLAIMQEKNSDTVDKLQNTDLFTTDPQEMIKIMEQGFMALQDYIVSFTENDLLQKHTKAFYSGEDSNGYSQAKWLVEITTHAFHHRGQLFNYLKQLGYQVNMFDLY